MADVDYSEILARTTDRPHLDQGEHASPGEGMCAMELVSFVAGEPFSDAPKCVCRVIGAFVRAWNDGLPDDTRDNLLLPILPALIGTATEDLALIERRAMMAADWVVREYVPTWLRAAGLNETAATLAALPELRRYVDWDDALAAVEAAYMAAPAETGPSNDEAFDASWEAARAATRFYHPARNFAAGTARKAADAATPAARAAAQKELAQSMRALLCRMIAAKKD